MTSEAINQRTRERVAKLYEKGDTTEIIITTQALLEIGHKAGKNFGYMTNKLRDCGVKPDELGMAVCLALNNIPAEELNELDRFSKILADDTVKKFNDSLAASSSSLDRACDKEPEVSKETWLFGEMQLDLSKSYDEIYDKAFDIAENCGYMVTKGKDTIQIYGEDCPDEYTIVNTIYFVNGKVNMVLKNTLKGDKQISSKGVQLE